MTEVAEPMRIARYYNNGLVRVELVRKPTICQGEVLVRVMACGICGSDVMEWFRVPKSPRILGHEISGVVVESRSASYVEGTHVVVRNQVPCGRCDACRDGHPAVCEHQVEIEPGGMAEYVRIPAEVVRSGLSMLPPELSFDAGTLAEPLACVLHAQELAALASHHCAVVFGCGAFGLLHIQAALSISVGRILAVDKVESRIRSAISLGASGALTSDDLAGKVRTINNGQLADVAIIATGDPNALTLASDILTRHGTILLFGAPDPKELLSLSLNKLFWRRELTIVSSYGAGDVAFSRPLDLLRRGAVDSARIITHRVPLSEVQRAFDLATRTPESIKVILDTTQ